MDFLFSNQRPLVTSYRNFRDTFYNLMSTTDKLDLAVGYVTADSMLELRKIIEQNKHKPELNLLIGMHYFDGFTKTQYNAAKNLNEYLNVTGLGEVSLVNAFRYHGKIYSFSDSVGAFAGIIGSNNLSSLDDVCNTYEAAAFINERDKATELKNFISNLASSSCVGLDEFPMDRIKEENPVLEGHPYVSKVSRERIQNIGCELTSTVFEIPLKAEEKSNLNVYFGKGRKDKRGMVKPRPWYEVELIVSNRITRIPGYPQKDTPQSIFTVVTDDGWSFKCNVSGDNSKNFRSDDDLKILGKWIKGRLESNGALTTGEMVTEETFRKYGRHAFTFTKTKDDNFWFLDFGVK